MSAGGSSASSLPAWGILAIAATALLSPVLAFLLAIAVEIVIVVCRSRGAEIRRLGGWWRPGLVLVSQAVGPAAREGQGRDLSGALRPRGWRGLRELIRGALHYGET